MVEKANPLREVTLYYPEGPLTYYIYKLDYSVNHQTRFIAVDKNVADDAFDNLDNIEAVIETMSKADRSIVTNTLDELIALLQIDMTNRSGLVNAAERVSQAKDLINACANSIQELIKSLQPPKPEVENAEGAVVDSEVVAEEVVEEKTE